MPGRRQPFFVCAAVGVVGVDSYRRDGHGTGFRGSISGYHRPEYAAVRKADREPHCISDEFLRAVLEGVHREFTTRAILQKYKLGSSANVSIVKRALLKKELIEMEKRQVVIPDPVMEEWLRRELGL